MSDYDHAVAQARTATVTEHNARLALSLLDLTSLELDDTDADIDQLCRRAQSPCGPVAAVCVYPRFVAQARRSLERSGIRIATVVNFPHGEDSLQTVANDTAAALDDGADEIDVVLPYRQYLDGDENGAFRVVDAVCGCCRDRAKVKLILETGRLHDATAIRSASARAIDSGVDFLKTSTGKIDVNATLEAAAIMLECIRDHLTKGGGTVGCKPSGGIRSSAEAAQYLKLAELMMGSDWARPSTFRFGASSLLDALLQTLGHAPDASADPSTSGAY